MPQTAEKFLPGKFSRSGFIAFGLTTGFCLFMGELLAAVAAAAAAGLCLAGTHQGKAHQNAPWPQLRAFFLTALVLALASAIWLGP